MSAPKVLMLNFDRLFAHPIRTGAKRQTIREARARVHVPQVGDEARCWMGLRTSKLQLLGTWPVVRVDVVRMTIGADAISDVLLGSEPVRGYALMVLADAEGFGNWPAMQAWFCRHYHGDFYGWLIGWAWAPVPDEVIAFTPQGRDNNESKQEHGNTPQAVQERPFV